MHLVLKPSFVEILLNFSDNLSLECLPSDCLSDCLVVFVCLPTCISSTPPRCAPVYLLIVRRTPLALSDETYHGGDEEHRRQKAKKGGAVQSRRV